MASTYTAAGIELIAQGEQAGAWGATTNTNWELVEEMIGGVVDISLTGSTYSLSTTDGATSEGRHSVLNFSGSPGATCTVTVTPNDMQKVYFVVNGSDETVTISQGSGANVSVSAGKNKIVFCDGAGAGAAVTDISSGFDATTLAELGVTASAAELNILDGATLDVTELNYVDGVTSSIQTQLDAMVEKAGDTMTGALTLSGDPTSALHASTKQYVDTIASAGIHYHDPVRGEVSDSEGNLNATYNNGSSGVGATLTNAGANAAFNYGGISDWGTGERVLIYSQTDQTQNGVYTVTTVGDGSTAWVLTRATDADSYSPSDPDSFGTGDAFFVQEGNGAGELYVMNTTGTITFGTTNITFTQIASTAIYAAGTNITLDGTTFNVDDAFVLNTGDAITGDLTFGDSNKAIFGAGSDLQIYHDGSNSYIDDTGTGWLYLRADERVILASQSTGNVSAKFFTNAQAELAYNNATKLATTSTGIDVTGNIAVSGTVDGRDVASDGTKLDGIESGAKDDQTITAGSYLTGGGTGDITLNVDATTTNTASKVVARDASGNFAAGTITAALSGNASTATAWATGRTLTLSGDVSGTSSTIDGTGNITLTATVADDSHNHVISNVDGLQTALDAKAALSGASFTGSVYSTGNIGLDGGDHINFSDNAHMNVVINSLTRFRFEADGDFHADGDVIAYSTTISDERLKENIVGIDDALSKVAQLNGYTFTYKADGKISAGVIAQEVEKVLPEAVSEKELPLKADDGEQYKVVNYDALHGLLIEAVKELSAKVEELEAKVG